LGYHQIVTNAINLMRRTLTRRQKPPKQKDDALLERDGLIDTDELATYLGFSVATLDTWASRGGGPAFHKVGRFRKYQPADVKEWLKKRRTADKQEPAA
jgi:excisionase family DNA binding protein